ncbi:MAG: phosphoribosyltransferase [Deltaproteobacteria bacterium]|nr:MAG: phosphoribosyltransferase [Deltaproteobacteria bacterium]
MIFRDRREAGRQLAAALTRRGYTGKGTLVLGIPRGGLVVADEVARALSATLDVIIARKLRAPYQPELGIGALVNGDHITLNEELSRAVGATREYIDREIAYQKEEIERRLQFYRKEHPAPEVSGKTVIVVDDGIATGYTFRAALESLRERHPDRLAAAAPVAAPDSAEMLKAFADEVVCLSTPVFFLAVGRWYQNFDQVSDEEAATILHRNWSRWSQAALEDGFIRFHLEVKWIGQKPKKLSSLQERQG